jgi:hypothetical protein
VLGCLVAASVVPEEAPSSGLEWTHSVAEFGDSYPASPKAAPSTKLLVLERVSVDECVERSSCDSVSSASVVMSMSAKIIRFSRALFQ